MKISVITITYNNLDGLRRTIPSIVSQTFQDFEFIVIDGNSSDGSKEYLAGMPRINKLVSEPDSGIYNAMNKGVKLAEGEYSIFMNSGDTFFSAQTLELCAEILGEHDFIAGRSVYLEPKKLYPCIPPQELTIEFLTANSLSHQSLFTRTKILKEVPFREDFRIVSDWEQYFRAWFLKGYTHYLSSDIYMSIFYCDGISFTHRKLYRAEKAKGIEGIMADCEDESRRLSPTGVKRAIQTQRLKDKIEKTFKKSSPVKRDLGIIRYGFKALWKDLFS